MAFSLRCDLHRGVELVTVHVVGVVAVRGQVPQFPVRPLVKQRGVRHQLPFHGFALAVEAEVLHCAADVQRARFPVEVERQPVVHLECEDVRRGADLQHEVVASRAVERARRYEEQVVPRRLFGVDVARHVEFRAFFEAFGQRPFELRRVDILFEPEVYDRPGCRVEDIVSLLLSQYLAEILADIFPLRVALDRKVAAVEVVEVVHADREFVAVCVVARAADDLLAALEHHHVERHFEHLAAAAEDQPVFRYDQLERPCVIGHVVGQCADVFADPLASPRPGFEPRPDAESVCGEPRRRSVPSAQVISPSRCPSTIMPMRGSSSFLWRFSTTQSTK